MSRRQPNQYRVLQDENDLTEGAEKLLNFVVKYQYTYNVTNKQYSKLIGVNLRNTIKYMSELIKKGYIHCSSRKGGQAKANTYRVIKRYKTGESDV